MKLKMTNGNKPSWLAYLTAAGIIVMLIFTFTRLSDRIFAKGTNTALLTQEVKDIDTRLAITERDIKDTVRTVNKHYTDIEILKVQFVDLGEDMAKQTRVTEKLNDRLDKLLDKL